MKNILLIFFFSPLFLLGQEIDNFLIGYTAGVVQDLYRPDNDINPFSPDMKSKIDDEYNFTPYWTPPFIDKIVSEDRCHLNGMAMKSKESIILIMLEDR